MASFSPSFISLGLNPLSLTCTWKRRLWYMYCMVPAFFAHTHTLHPLALLYSLALHPPLPCIHHVLLLPKFTHIKPSFPSSLAHTIASFPCTIPGVLRKSHFPNHMCHSFSKSCNLGSGQRKDSKSVPKWMGEWEKGLQLPHPRIFQDVATRLQGYSSRLARLCPLGISK